MLLLLLVALNVLLIFVYVYAGFMYVFYVSSISLRCNLYFIPGKAFNSYFSCLI